ncbi:hypothetical protein V9L05_20400 [Bernardetia sp. Wsw4-3y2]|uniref:hypothetical protein n=1 Tax=unclassified Bernardetia TaxID=2647129 RepID=UPI0030D17DA0
MNQSIYKDINTLQSTTPKVIVLPQPTLRSILVNYLSELFSSNLNEERVRNSKKLFFGLFLIVIFFTLGISSAFAQDDFVEDPMGKSSIWQQLTENPTDSTLWENYYGKPFSAMNQKEAEKVNGWKQELMLRKLASNDAVIGFVITDEIDEGFFIDEAAFREFEAQIQAAKASGQAATITFKDIQGLEAIIMPEWEGMSDLKQNIAENFVILEDMYKDIFTEQGIDFQNYTVAHPDGKYSQIKWIEELDGKLRKAKENQLKELKKKYNMN